MHGVLVISGSVFKVPIEDVVDAGKARMYGPGLNPEGVRATLPATFTVDCTEAGKAPLEVCTASLLSKALR